MILGLLKYLIELGDSTLGVAGAQFENSQILVDTRVFRAQKLPAFSSLQTLFGEVQLVGDFGCRFGMPRIVRE